MPQEFLDRPDVVAVLQQVGGERVPERMAARRFGNAGPAHSLLHRPLHDRLVEVMPAALTGSGIDVGPRGREDPLPSPLPPGHRVLAGECAGEFNPPGTTPQVLPVLVADDLQMSCQISTRIPAPLRRSAISFGVPRMCRKTLRTSSRVRTTGRRLGAEGLVLGRGADLSFEGERRQEPTDLGLAHLHGMALAVE